MSETESVDIVLTTGRRMDVPEHETPLLVEALAELGLRAVIAPWGEGTDWSSVPLVVVRTTWDYVGVREEFLAWARSVAAVTRLVNPPAVLEWNSHKGYLAGLAAAGVPTVPTVHVPRDAGTASRREALAAFSGDVVVKPAVSAGARGALRADAASGALADHLAKLTEVGDALVQPLVPSVLERGEVSLLYFGGAFSHAVRKIAAPGDYRVQDDYGGTVVPHLPTDAELRLAERVLAAAPEPVPYARVDLVDLAEEPVLMELEVIEPELFLPVDESSAGRFAQVLAGLLARG